jgi:hypothetical protein
MMIVTFCQLVCPLNEYNDGRLCSCQGQLVLLPPMIFFWNQSSHICCDGLSVTLTDVSCFDFWNLAVARGVLSCLSPTSTCACHDSCYLHLFLSVVIVIIRWAKRRPCHHWREDRECDSETLAKIFDSRRPIKFLNQIAHKIIWIELSLYPDRIPNSNQRYPDF